MVVENDDQIKEQALMLIAKMKQAFEQDNKSNEQKKPALAKLMMLTEITKELRKKSLQGHFIDNGGVRALGFWLTPLPDNTTPNLKILQEIL